MVVFIGLTYLTHEIMHFLKFKYQAEKDGFDKFCSAYVWGVFGKL